VTAIDQFLLEFFNFTGIEIGYVRSIFSHESSYRLSIEFNLVAKLRPVKVT
jgi:hypothetical protein